MSASHIDDSSTLALLRPSAPRSRWTTLSLAMIPAAVAINLSIGGLVQTTKVLPLYLDSIGTALMGFAFGPIVGLATGVLTSLIGSVTVAPVFAWFVGTSACIGLWSGYVGKRGWTNSWWKTGLAGVAMGVMAAIVSAPIFAFLFGGVTLSGTSAIVALLRVSGQSVIHAVLAVGVVAEPIDKAASFLVALAVIRAMPNRLASRMPLIARARALRDPAQ